LLKSTPAASQTGTIVADCGVALETFDSRTPQSTTMTRSRMESAATTAELRRLERLLRPPRREAAHPHVDGLATSPPTLASLTEVEADLTPRVEHPKSNSSAVPLLLTAGATALLCGLTLLVTATSLVNAGVWRWGFILATTGQAILLAGLLAMVGRLSQNSRRVDTQLERVDHQLTALRSACADVTAPGSARGSRCIR
jgi:hypothetical protein